MKTETVTYNNTNMIIVGILEYQQHCFYCLAIPEYAVRIQQWWSQQTWPAQLLFKPIPKELGEEIWDNNRLIGVAGWQRKPVTTNNDSWKTEYHKRLCQMLENY